MTAAQIFSIVAFVIGIVIVLWARSRPPVMPEVAPVVEYRTVADM